MEIATFSWLDYTLFGLMLASSAFVGVFYGLIRKQDTANDYLLGGKQMSVWPIAMSIVSSTLSGFTLLSVPADIYKYGITYGIVVPGNLLVGVIAYYLFLPVFSKLQVTSVYEYLAVRFSNKVRIFGSLLYAIYMVLFLPIVIYIPALALGQATSLNVHLITPILCGVCIFYTTLGGLKAVVWTDVIQFGVMVGSIVVVTAVGVWNGGGFATILENSRSGGRLDISYELDILKRDTFWAVFIGQSIHMTSYFAVGQSSVQKFMSLPSFSSIKAALILSMIGTSFIVALSIFSGLLMYSRYVDCDPFEANLIASHDQILPFYVMQEIGFIPGLAGLFISGIFSAGLSTLSAIMNCLAATIYEDFISPFVPKRTSQKRVSQYLKLIVVIIGIISTASVYIVERLGSLVALTLGFAGVTSGPILGLFTVGILAPNVTTKGALSGGVISLCTMAWIIFGSLWYKTRGMFDYPILPISTAGCNETINETVNRTIAHAISTINPNLEAPLAVYRVSFYWYAGIGFTITVIVAIIVSCFTKDEKSLNKDCISPMMHFLIKDKNGKPPKYDDVAVMEMLNK